MAMDDALDQGQSDPSPFKFSFTVKPLEDSKEVLGILGVKPGSVVLNVILAFCALALTADFDPGRLAVPGEFDGIGQQVDKNLVHQDRIASGREERFQNELRDAYGHVG